MSYQQHESISALGIRGKPYNHSVRAAHRIQYRPERFEVPFDFIVADRRKRSNRPEGPIARAEGGAPRAPTAVHNLSSPLFRAPPEVLRCLVS
jgi:hypothetical protein